MTERHAIVLLSGGLDSATALAIARSQGYVCHTLAVSYGQRHAVRPGVTGWAQVRHRYGNTVEDSLEKLQYDLFYIKHLSIAFDLFVILETMKTVITRRGS